MIPTTLKAMLTTGSVSRDDAAGRFDFLAAHYRGRRQAIKEFTHRDPDFVFWVYPDGRLHDARNAHRRNVPRGYQHILHDEPDYGGFLRGRVATNIDGDQLIVVYCRPEALAASGPAVIQLLRGVRQMPIPISRNALCISDNGDLYGTLADLEARSGEVDEAD